jgi:signal peptidase I
MDEMNKKSSTRDTFESLVVTVILAIFGTTFVLQAFKIPTGSMEDTLLIGDHLLVNKYIFAPQGGLLAHLLPYRDLRRGDVVVFKFTPTDTQQQPGEHFVKRVIGVPGDHVRIFHRQVFVNGKLQNEPFVRLDPDDANQLHPEDDFPRPDGDYLFGSSPSWDAQLASVVQNGEIVVPPGKYFMMGDNREQSWDSRFWGFVDRSEVIGRPVLIYWSFVTDRDEINHNTLSDRISQVVDLIIHFPTKTRWRRSFNFVR